MNELWIVLCTHLPDRDTVSSFYIIAIYESLVTKYNKKGLKSEKFWLVDFFS